MNFFIHIGTHKTGSTALQHFLLINRAKLQEHGFLYPETGLKDAGHHKIAWASRSKDTFPQLNKLMQLVRGEANKLKCPNIILSSEEFEFGRDINHLKTALAGDNCKIIVFLRRQDTLLESEYNQHVKMHLTKYSHSIFKFHFDHDFNQRFNYKYLCNLWTHKFGQEAMSVVSYDNCSREPQGIFKEFLNVIKVPFDDGFLLPEEGHANASLPSKAILYLARLNTLSLTKNQHQLAIRILVDEFASQKKQALLSLNDRKLLWARYEGVNGFVENTYNTSCFVEPSETEHNDEYLDFCNDFDVNMYAKIIKRLLGGGIN